MPKTADIDMELRSRLRAWVRYFYRKYSHQYPTQLEFSRALGLSAATIANIINGRRTAGLDVVVRLHRTFHISSDLMIDTDPPKQKTESPGFV